MKKNAPDVKIPEVVPVVVVVPDDNNKPIDTNIPDVDPGVSNRTQNGNDTNPKELIGLVDFAYSFEYLEYIS